MKHCICLEDNRILYVYGGLGPKGFQIKYSDLAVFTDQDKRQVIRQFVSKNHLKQKIVYLALDSGILFSMINLPKAKSKIQQEMVHNELAASIGNGQELIVCSVPFKESSDGIQTMVLTYTMFEQEFWDQIRFLREAGLHLHRAYVLSNCIGEMAQRIFPIEKLMIQIEAAENQLRLLLIDKGRCILARNIRLNVRHFCETLSDHLLYDEIAEQVSKMIQFHIGRNKEDEIEKIIFLSDVVTDKVMAAKGLGELLNIPCESPELSFRTINNIDPAMAKRCHHALAVLVKASGRQAKQVDLLAAGRSARSRQLQYEMNRGGLRFSMVLAVNVMVLTGAGLGLYSRNLYYQRQIDRLTEYIHDDNRQIQYREALQKVKQVADANQYQKSLHSYTSFVQRQNVLRLSDYQVNIREIPDPERIEGVRYTGSDRILEIDLLVDSPGDAADIIERIRATEYFNSVSHTYWRQETGSDGQLYYATTVISQIMEGNDDATD